MTITPNIELIRKVADAILAEPKNFNMNFWCDKSPVSVCGTAGCIAGHTLLQSGYQMVGFALFAMPDGTTVVQSPRIEAEMLLGIESGDYMEFPPEEYDGFHSDDVGVPCGLFFQSWLTSETAAKKLYSIANELERETEEEIE